MTHKIKLTDYQYLDDYGVRVEVDGIVLVMDGQYTYNCLGEILTHLGVDFQIEYLNEEEISTIRKKKMRLVEDDND